jgi:hypothetical protein
MRILMLAGALSALVAARSHAADVDLVATVDLKFIRATDETASVMCSGDKEDNCAVWATLNIYQARIRKLHFGTESRKTVLVYFGKHALKEMDFRRLTVTMSKLESKSESDPQYRIWDWADKRKLFCFPRRQDENEGLELKRDGEQSLTCYDDE